MIPDRHSTILGLTAIVIAVGFGLFMWAPAGDFSVTSISEVTYQPPEDVDNTWWDGDAIVVNMIDDNTAENLNIHLSASELEDQLGLDGDSVVNSIEDPLELSVEETTVNAHYGTTQAGSETWLPIEEVRTERVAYGDDDDPSLEDLRLYIHENFLCVDMTEELVENHDYEEHEVPDAEEVNNYFEGGCSPEPYESQLEINDGSVGYGYVREAKLGEPFRLLSPQEEVFTEFTISNPDTGESATEIVGRGVGEDIEEETFFEVNFGSLAGERIAHINWQGSLRAQNQEEPSNEIAIEDPSTGEWKLAEEQAYFDWRSEVHFNTGDLQSQIQDVADESSLGGGASSTQEDMMDDIDSDFQSLESSATSEFTGSPLYSNTRGSFTGDGTYVLTNEGQPLFPEFTLTVRGAEFISITRGTGQPEVVGIFNRQQYENEDGDLVIGAGESLDLPFTVENVGSSDGTFSTNVACSSDNFGSEDRSGSQTVDGGTQEIFEHRLSFSGEASDGVESTTCTFDVEETGDTGDDFEDEFIFNVQGDPNIACTPGSTVTHTSDSEIEQLASEYEDVDVDSGGALEVCDEDGGGYDLHIACEEDEELEPDTSAEYGYACVDGGGERTTGDCDVERSLGGLSLEYTSPVCAVQEGLSGLLEGGQNALLLVRLGVGAFVTILVTSFFGGQVASRVSEDTATRAGIVFGGFIMGLFLGFAAFQWLASPLSWLAVFGIGFLYLTIQSMIPSAS